MDMSSIELIEFKVSALLKSLDFAVAGIVDDADIKTTAIIVQISTVVL